MMSERRGAVMLSSCLVSVFSKYSAHNHKIDLFQLATKRISQTRDRCPLMRGREKWVAIVNLLTSCYASIRPRSWTWCSSRPQPRQATTWSSCSEGWPPPCLAWRALSQRRTIWPRFVEVFQSFGMFSLECEQKNVSITPLFQVILKDTPVPERQLESGCTC